MDGGDGDARRLEDVSAVIFWRHDISAEMDGSITA
jgi:hypothetical protein